MLHDQRLDVSFSGLKTAVLYEVRGRPGSDALVPEMTAQRRCDIAASFQEAVVDVLVAKCRRAVAACARDTLLVGGGVAANKRLRDRLTEAAEREHFSLYFAPLEFCTDNAAMAAIAWEALEQGNVADLDIDVTPGLIRGE
jgi:N6-L-threonylcarbamoyladenine synthase